MENTLLTPEDREWLAKLAAANRTRFDLILHGLRTRNAGCDHCVAGAVPIWYEGAYTEAADVLRIVASGVPAVPSLEEWTHQVHQAVAQAASLLSAGDSRALYLAAGFSVCSQVPAFKSDDGCVGATYEALYTWIANDEVEDFVEDEYPPFIDDDDELIEPVEFDYKSHECLYTVDGFKALILHVYLTEEGYLWQLVDVAGRAHRTGSGYADEASALRAGINAGLGARSDETATNQASELQAAISKISHIAEDLLERLIKSTEEAAEPVLDTEAEEIRAHILAAREKAGIQPVVAAHELGS